eukprot:GHRR01033146.1.p1 GENE.GHRR01033146.1~~GHRR01033146.1.p1  ORF type:complete len:203 (+),score=31.85 GHRR01033146.1:562-1170(+)
MAQQQQQQHADQPHPGQGTHNSEATSRLCVKNIPKHLTEQRLKEHFSVNGHVTDVKILKTRDGQSRQMAFVGYCSVKDATHAIKYFQNTYIDTSKTNIEVRPAALYRDGIDSSATSQCLQGPAIRMRYPCGRLYLVYFKCPSVTCFVLMDTVWVYTVIQYSSTHPLPGPHAVAASPNTPVCMSVIAVCSQVQGVDSTANSCQ